MGHYLYDDEGVKARRVTVVDKGILKTFLARPRAASQASPQSNGHGRAEPGYVPVSRQSNLVVESSRSVSTEKLLDMLRDEARKQGKPFGLLFDNIEGGFTNTGRGSANAFNVLPNVVYRDLHRRSRPPELVRGVDLIGTPLVGVRRRSSRPATRWTSSTASAAPKAAACRCPPRRRRCWSARSRCRRRRSRRRRCRFCRRRERRGSPDMRTASRRCRRRRRASPSCCRSSPAPRAQESPILSAMRDEMKRSMADLRMKDEPAPYYIEYEIDDIASMRVIARLGGIVGRPRRTTRGRCASRCASATTRSTARGSSPRIAARRGAVASATVPLDDDYDAIRRQIWLATDAAYKRAVSVFARKKAAFQNRAGRGSDPRFLARDAGADRPAGLAPAPIGPPSGSIAPKQLSAVFVAQPGHRVLRSLDLRSARHALLPEQRRLQGRHAGLDRRTSASPPRRRPTTA